MIDKYRVLGLEREECLERKFHVLRDEIIKSLAIWIGDVDNGNPNPSSWVKFVFVVVCKPCDSLTPLSMP